MLHRTRAAQPRSIHGLAACLLLWSACSSGPPPAGGLGERCSAARRCAYPLQCRDSVCAPGNLTQDGSLVFGDGGLRPEARTLDAALRREGGALGCDGGGCAASVTIVADAAGRRWSNGTLAASCSGYRRPTPPYRYEGAVGDGLYAVQPPGQGALQVQCDMQTAGGGWTLVQRTVWSWTASQTLMTGFAAFWEQTIGDVGALSGAWRAAGKLWLAWNVDRELLMAYTPRKAATGNSCGTLFYRGTSAVLTGDAAQKVMTLGGLQGLPGFDSSVFSLSTTDSGPAASTCVTAASAVPWFYTACCSSCPTYLGGYWSDEPRPMVGFIGATADLNGHTAAEACGADAAIKSVETGDASNPLGHAFYGLNRLEVYLR
ncbi:MAG: hypothetical protein IPG96_08285 [Proteobacteria bacterium]|nr:hypothetical protein [Pseudomonadota bacterium]